MPKPSPRRATASPISPGPTIPSVAPWTSWPSQPAGSHVHHSPLRTEPADSTIRRETARIRAKARSAVVSVRTPGVLPTAIPRSVA